ncbi:MAG TPA: UDP-N-acetylglucosamine 2-epimerase [Kiritimatiellia bacterium]|nr:UDP-N-acetylglucosamine 2-epimerase [Kiritimatiellia bacterium]
MKRKICAVTGTRAEYGLLYFLLHGISRSADLELQLIVTGAHLSPEFGLTWREIEKDGFRIDKKVEMLLSADTPSSIAKSMGLGLIGFADALNDLKPDMLLLLGDRYELASAALAALVARVPIAHIHGGETTEGAIDEAIRHSITKMSWLHFVAAEEYRRRVIQMGEDPSRVHLVGGMGVDAIKKTKLLNRQDLEKSMGFRFGKKNLLITFHPVTLESGSAGSQFEELLLALGQLKDTHFIFTAPNADAEGRVISGQIDKFVLSHPNVAVQFVSLGRERYLSTLQFVDAVVGNSSSGLAEAPTFKTGTINIGDRQKGRLKAESVIDCPPRRDSILEALNTLYSAEFAKRLAKTENPYGDGDATEKIIKILETINLPDEPKKGFYEHKC